MRCTYCGREILEGHLFCEFCGNEIQIVPDFNELEEELLPQIVSGRDNSGNTASYPNYNRPSEDRRTNIDYRFPEKQKKKSKKGVIIFSVILLSAVSVFIASKLLYKNSYAYFIDQGMRYDTREDYSEALKYYERAADKKTTAEVYLYIGRDLVSLSENVRAEQMLQKAMQLDREDPGHEHLSEIYEAMFELYDRTRDYAAAEGLFDGITDSSIKEEMKRFYVRPPEFSMKDGDYDSDIELSLTSSDNYDIYYTLDGSDPSDGSGILYNEPILLESGVTTVTACCINDEGKWGAIEEHTYGINYSIPQKPAAKPGSGTFHEPGSITLSSPDPKARIYYTWDGSVPDENSRIYSGPIRIPEGNNVLSAICIDEHGMSSDVLRCNYIYLP